MKLLFVDCAISQRGVESRTKRLCESFLKEIIEVKPNSKLEHLDLKNMLLEPFDVSMLNKRDMLAIDGAFDDASYALANQFQKADAILVGAPFWDMSFPAKLRIYIEHICANGINYYYDEQGPHGNCRAKWLVYLTTGGDFERRDSLGVLYWKQLASMFGIERYESIFAGGLDILGQDSESILAVSCEKAKELARSLVKK